VMDPSKKEDGADAYKPKLTFAKSTAGDVGALLDSLNSQFHNRIEAHYAAGTIKKTDQRKIHDIIKYRRGEQAKKNPGEIYEDPICELKINFDKFPDNYFIDWLKGKQKTQILDYDKQQIVDGKIVFGPATVVNEAGVEEPVSFENLHKFITVGSVLKRGRAELTSTSVSQYWISMQINAQELVIKTGGGGGFLEEDADDFYDPSQHQTTEGGNTANGGTAEGSENVTPVDESTAAEAINNI